MLKSTRIHAEDLVRAASDRCVEERSARMAIADTTDRSVRTVADLRRSRRALRAESAQLGRWRRLVRARMDLALASLDGTGAARPRDTRSAPAARR